MEDWLVTEVSYSELKGVALWSRGGFRPFSGARDRK